MCKFTKYIDMVPKIRDSHCCGGSKLNVENLKFIVVFVCDIFDVCDLSIVKLLLGKCLEYIFRLIKR